MVVQKSRVYTDMIGMWASMEEALNCDRESISKHDLSDGKESFAEGIKNRWDIIYNNQFAKLKDREGDSLVAPIKVSNIKNEDGVFSYQIYAFNTDSNGKEEIVKILGEEIKYDVKINRTGGIYNNSDIKALCDAYSEYAKCKKEKEEAVYKGVQNTIGLVYPPLGTVVTNINDIGKFLNSKNTHEYVSNGKKLVMKSSTVKDGIKKIDKNGSDRINSVVDIYGNIDSYIKATENMNNNISDIMENNILASFGNTVYGMDDLGKRVYSNGVYDPFMVASICELNEKGIVNFAKEIDNAKYSILENEYIKKYSQDNYIYSSYVTEKNTRLEQIDEVIDIIINGSEVKSLLDYDNIVLTEAKACINQGLAYTINQEDASIDSLIREMRSKYEAEITN